MTLEDEAFEKGEEYGYIPIETNKSVKEVSLEVAALMKGIERLQLEMFIYLLPTSTYAINERKVPLPKNSHTPHHDVSVLHSLMKEELSGIMCLGICLVIGEMTKGEISF